MPSGIVGFALGVALTLLVLAVLQQIVVRQVKGDLRYRFTHFVFGGPEFPRGYIDQGRLVNRVLFPRVETTFHDAEYHEVARADKPGRYGAVVRIRFLGGAETIRYITLYRTPEKVFWSEAPIPVTMELPSGIGIDPGVARIQQGQIGRLVKGDFIGNADASPGLAVLLAGLSETSPAEPPAVERTSVKARDADWWCGLRECLGLAQEYPFLVDLPRDYNADPTRRWPLIIFLHIAIQGGRDLRRLRLHGLARLMGEGKQLPAIVVSPQRPLDESWNPLVLGHLIDTISSRYRVDLDRISLTGCSAGGDGTWALALAYPDRFSAIAPICGESDPADAGRLKDLPVWAFHGADDSVIPISETLAMVDVIRKAGGRPHLTIVPGAGHGESWDAAYANDALYTWLLAQKRGQPEVLTPGLPPAG